MVLLVSKDTCRNAISLPEADEDVREGWVSNWVVVVAVEAPVVTAVEVTLTTLVVAEAEVALAVEGIAAAVDKVDSLSILAKIYISE
jgi:hypothetical protein